MDISGSNGNHTARVFSYAINHKLSLAGITASVPVFFVASSAHIFSQPKDINTASITLKGTKGEDSKQNNLQEINAQEDTTQPHDGSSNADANDTTGNNSQTFISIDGQSIKSSTSSDAPNQSLNKTITTENGTATVSIDQRNQTSEDGTTRSTTSVHIDSHNFGSGNSSASINQRSIGGAPH
jgi:hypothetical protein